LAAEPPLNVGRASRLPSFKDNVEMHPVESDRTIAKTAFRYFIFALQITPVPSLTWPNSPLKIANMPLITEILAKIG
jgi:hypothetical protein